MLTNIYWRFVKDAIVASIFFFFFFRETRPPRFFVAAKMQSFCGCRFVGTIGCQSTMHNVLFSPMKNRFFLPPPKRDSRKFIDDGHYRNSSALLREPSPSPSTIAECRLCLIFPLSAFPFIYRANRAWPKLST